MPWSQVAPRLLRNPDFADGKSRRIRTCYRDVRDRCSESPEAKSIRAAQSVDVDSAACDKRVTAGGRDSEGECVEFLRLSVEIERRCSGGHCHADGRSPSAPEIHVTSVPVAPSCPPRGCLEMRQGRGAECQ